MSATQFALLFALGIRETDLVLDVGCGSLRLGRLLIPFLLPQRYFGVDPNEWLIDDSIRREIGSDAIVLKKPSFAYRDDFVFDEFGTKFDFVMAQSIATHTGPDQMEKLFAGVSDVLADEGLFIFTHKRHDSDVLPGNGWHYPDVVNYRVSYVIEKLSEVDLVARPIPWYHPGGAQWVLAVKTDAAMPSVEQISALTGTTISRRRI